MTEEQLDLFSEHLDLLARRWEAALAFAGFDAAIVVAGQPGAYFLDDQTAPFRPNPHFAQWFPEDDAAGSALLIRPGERPRLYFFQPADYWHQPPPQPDWADKNLDLEVFDDPARLQEALATAAAGQNRTAYVGEQPPGNLSITSVNPALLLNHLHFHRAYKSGFEVHCMQAATEQAVAGHRAARDAFRAGGSEFEIHMAYLTASRQTSDALPYGNIVALNEHGAVLHYQHYDRKPPDQSRSFLIDAGGRYRGYAADITRTYPAEGIGHERFAALVAAMDQAQQSMIREIRPGMDYVELHENAHRRIAGILSDQGLLHCSAETAFDTGLTTTFLPHGLGHLIGLQTHDVGGLQTSPEGGHRAPPDSYPALRLTRTMEQGQVFTIEPGLYFIPQLLDKLQGEDRGRLVHWKCVDALRSYGGIRIEDNVLLTGDGTANLTRDAFARHE
jgi:Xaa-Pro dipeptidase